MESLRPALIAGFVGALCALVITILLLAHVPAVIVALIVVPGSVGVLIALWVWRLGSWREGSQRRAVLQLQSAGALLIARSISGTGLGVLQAAGSITASETPDSLRVVVEYALGSRGGVLWDLLSAVLGLGFIMASVWIARSPAGVAPGSTSSASHVPILDPPPVTQSQLNRARTYKTYDSDLPPRTEFWVGREEEVRLGKELRRGVLTITGIGGQGKSYLAAKLLESWRSERPNAFWDWRDCREEGDRLETQLVSIIERVTAGDIAAHTLKDADSVRLARLLFRITRSTYGILVLDNVDHYTNAEQGTFVGGVAALVQEALRSKTEFLIVVTCRPRVSYPDISFREIPLRGLSLDETKALFRAKGADLRRFQDPDEAIRRIHRHTRGHPFWLNVISTQIQRMPQMSSEILEEMTADTGDDRIVAMLRPVWRGLNDNQKLILHIMSESPKAEQRDRLERYALAEIPSANQFSRAFRTLESLGLVVGKEERDVDTRYEIHPVVRQFINQEFPSRRERARYMQAISSNCGEHILRLHRLSDDRLILSVETFEYAAIGTEMQLRSGDTIAGVKSIGQIHAAFIGRGLSREILRLADLAVDQLDWGDASLGNIPELHAFVTGVIETYVENMREEAARRLVGLYSPLVLRGTAHYVSWCSTMSHMEWILGNYQKAIEWGREGARLKETSQMDTRADAAQYLNLSLRDSGRVSEALPYFLQGHTVEEVVSADHHEEEMEAPFYGNVGRCLYLLDRVEAARVCYARSADLLYEEVDSVSVVNQGWAGLWIGELCAKQGEWGLAVLFYRDCRNVWSVRAPLLLQRLGESLLNLPEGERGKVTVDDSSVRSQCVDQVRKWVNVG